MLKELNISPSSATNWKKGGDIKSSALIKLTDYFKCSTDYILDRTEKTEPTYNIENHSSIYGNVKHNENKKSSKLIEIAVEQMEKLEEGKQLDIVNYIYKLKKED